MSQPIAVSLFSPSLSLSLSRFLSLFFLLLPFLSSPLFCSFSLLFLFSSRPLFHSSALLWHLFPFPFIAASCFFGSLLLSIPDCFPLSLSLGAQFALGYLVYHPHTLLVMDMFKQQSDEDERSTNKRSAKTTAGRTRGLHRLPHPKFSLLVRRPCFGLLDGCARQT